MRLRSARSAVDHVSNHYRAFNLKPLYADQPGGNGRHIGWTFQIAGTQRAHGWVLTSGTACHGPVLGGREFAAAEGRITANHEQETTR
nr:hypothetical protein KitaXyl93_20500 [Kitasatospora sp. Xyl93]